MGIGPSHLFATEGILGVGGATAARRIFRYELAKLNAWAKPL